MAPSMPYGFGSGVGVVVGLPLKLICVLLSRSRLILPKNSGGTKDQISLPAVTDPMLAVRLPLIAFSTPSLPA